MNFPNRYQPSQELLGGSFNHLEKYHFVNGKDDIPYEMENKIRVPNHQPVKEGGLRMVPSIALRRSRWDHQIRLSKPSFQ